MSSESSENIPNPSSSESNSPSSDLSPTPSVSNNNNSVNSPSRETSPNKQPEYLLETLHSNSNSSFNSSQLNLDGSNYDFTSLNDSNLDGLGLGNREGYTILSPALFSTPAPSVNGNGSMYNSGYSMNNTAPIFTNMSASYGANPLLMNEANGAFGNKTTCLECGAYAYIHKCKGHCNKDICEDCREKHWQIEVDELLKMKNHLESSVSDLKNYLSAKKSQCNENIRNSQQIKRFINMTMNQIKRKVELELENKRDELFSSVDSFCDNQKKLSTSVVEDSFQSAERVCDEIENLLLNTENQVNMIKVNSLKTYAKSCTQKLNQQNNSRIPLYSIFFVPDSQIQVNNSFGKIVLKSYNPDAGNEQTTTLDDGQTFDESYFTTPLISAQQQSVNETSFYETPPTSTHQFSPPPQPPQQQALPTQFQQYQPQPKIVQVTLPQRPPPQLSFVPKYKPLSETQSTVSSPTPSSPMFTSTPSSLKTSQTNSELDAKRAEYMSKYAQRTQQQPVTKSETGGFIKKRTTNVYASQAPANQYQTTKNFMMQTPNELLIPAKFEDNSGSLSTIPPPLPKTPAPDMPVKSNRTPSVASSISATTAPAITVQSESEPAKTNSPQPAYTMSKPEVHDIKEESPLSETSDFMKCDTPNNFSYVSESEDGDGARFTDITVDHINSSNNLSDSPLSSAENNNTSIDPGTFENVFIRMPIKSQDLKLETKQQRPMLQVPGDSNGIREIKVIHTSPKITTVNGIRRFTNFQNSTSSSFDRSDLFVSSGSESGGSSSGTGNAQAAVIGQKLQKSFKAKTLFGSQTGGGGAATGMQTAKFVNS